MHPSELLQVWKKTTKKPFSQNAHQCMEVRSWLISLALTRWTASWPNRRKGGGGVGGMRGGGGLCVKGILVLEMLTVPPDLPAPPSPVATAMLVERRGVCVLLPSVSVLLPRLLTCTKHAMARAAFQWANTDTHRHTHTQTHTHIHAHTHTHAHTHIHTHTYTHTRTHTHTRTYTHTRTHTHTHARAFAHSNNNKTKQTLNDRRKYLTMLTSEQTLCC